MGLETTGLPGPVHLEQQFAVASAPLVHLLRGRITQRELDIACRLNDPRGTNGTGSESRTAGDRATLSFTGTGVRWISFGNNNNGIARVLLDGALVGEVDTFRPAEQPQIDVFSASGLTRGPHTLVIELTGRANPASTDVWVIVDAFDVTP